MPAQDVGWALAVTQGMDADAHELAFTQLEIVPYCADAFGVFNRGHLQDCTDLVFYPMRLLGADYLVRSRLAIGLWRLKVLENACDLGIGWQIPDDYTDPLTLAGASAVVGDPHFDSCLVLVLEWFD